LGGRAGGEDGGGVGWALPDTTVPPAAGAGLGAAATVDPRITTRPMPTIATSIAYSDNACPRRFRTGWLRLVSTTMLREE
jgi:hypothetical protein